MAQGVTGNICLWGIQHNTGSGAYDIWVGEQHSKHVMLVVDFVALEICFDFELFKLLPCIGREITSNAKQILEVI